MLDKVKTIKTFFDNLKPDCIEMDRDLALSKKAIIDIETAFREQSEKLKKIKKMVEPYKDLTLQTIEANWILKILDSE